MKNLGKVKLKKRDDASLFIYMCLLERYLMSTFETVLGSSPRQERPLLWAPPFIVTHSGPSFTVPLGKESAGPKGHAYPDHEENTSSQTLYNHYTTSYSRYSGSLVLWKVWFQACVGLLPGPSLGECGICISMSRGQLLWGIGMLAAFPHLCM